MKSSDRRAERERAEATLAAIDAALEDGRPGDDGDERERELGQLALTLHAGAPQPSASFAVDPEERVWAGFAESERKGRPLRSARPGAGADAGERRLSAAS